MDIIYSALVVLHLLGIIAIGYGFFKELVQKTYGLNIAMLVGASLDLITGVLLIAVYESMIGEGDESLGMTYIIFKFLMTLAIIAIYVVGKPQSKQKLYWALIGALTLITTVVSFAL